MTNLNDAGLGTFVIESTEYRYEFLAPIEAMTFGAKVSKLLGTVLIGVANGLDTNARTINTADINAALATVDPEETAKLGLEALKHCYVQVNGSWVSLKDESYFNKFFMEHPEQLYQASIQAIWNLASPFLPKAIRTIADGFAQRAKKATSM